MLKLGEKVERERKGDREWAIERSKIEKKKRGREKRERKWRDRKKVERER